MSYENEYESTANAANQAPTDASHALSSEIDRQFTLPDNLNRWNQQTPVEFQFHDLSLVTEHTSTVDDSTPGDKVAPAAQRSAQLSASVKDLGSENFDDRERAHTYLRDAMRDFPEQTAPLLARELLAPASIESRNRVQRLLSPLMNTVNIIENQSAAIANFQNPVKGSPVNPAGLDPHQTVCQRPGRALTSNEQAQMDLYRRAMTEAAASLDLITNTEPFTRLNAAIQEQAALPGRQVPIRLDYAKRMYLDAKDPTNPEVRAAVAAQLTQMLRDKPDLANEIPGNDAHNQLHHLLFKYGALAGAGRNPLFVSALIKAGGAPAYSSFRNRESAINTRLESGDK